MSKTELKREPLTWRGRAGVLQEPTLRICCFLDRICGPNCQAFNPDSKRCGLVMALERISVELKDLNDNLARGTAR